MHPVRFSRPAGVLLRFDRAAAGPCNSAWAWARWSSTGSRSRSLRPGVRVTWFRCDRALL